MQAIDLCTYDEIIGIGVLGCSDGEEFTPKAIS